MLVIQLIQFKSVEDFFLCFLFFFTFYFALVVFRYKTLPEVYSDYLCGDPTGVPVSASHEADCCCGQIPVLCSGNYTHAH